MTNKPWLNKVQMFKMPRRETGGALSKEGEMTIEEKMTLGERIKKARWIARMRQIDLAEKIGTGQNQITRWETNRATPRVETLAKIAKATGVPLSELMGEDDNHEQ